MIEDAVFQIKPRHCKALFLYSPDSGKANVRKHLDEIIAHLQSLFKKMDVFESPSPEEGRAKAKACCGVYDVLVVFGGDGTMRNVIQALAEENEPPILAYINGGTLNDFGSNFGIKGKHTRALKIIEDGYVTSFDVGKVNDQYFGYVAAVGAFANIPYTVKRKYKKKMGTLAYYFRSAKEAFIPRSTKGVLHVDGEIIPFKTPFVLCMSGKKMAGFHVSSKSRLNDGKFELYITKPGLFNGLAHYLFFKMRTKCYVSGHFYLEVDYQEPWDLDGEIGPQGNVEITCLPNRLRIYCSKRYLEHSE